LKKFRQLLARRAERFPKTATEMDDRRTLLSDDYFALHLFSLFNPVVKTMRGLCRATDLPKMREVCAQRVSLGSFSAGQHLFDPAILEDIVRDLAAQAQPSFGDARLREASKSLTAVDGTVLRAVHRMAWAPAGGHGCSVRVHLHFDVFTQMPEDWSITPGNVCERKVWAKKIKAGQFYINDRLYSNEHQLLTRVREAGADFVMRLNSNVILSPVETARELTAADRKAGVLWDQRMRLGVKEGGPVFRIIKISFADKELLLVTTREDLPAELIGLIYRYRWQIEVFFKWIKSLWASAHWIAESPRGVAIQIYTLFIGALFLFLWGGCPPTKRQLEALQFFYSGFTDEAGLELLLNLEENSKKAGH
jgi:hypothetical protein